MWRMHNQLMHNPAFMFRYFLYPPHPHLQLTQRTIIRMQHGSPRPLLATPLIASLQD